MKFRSLKPGNRDKTKFSLFFILLLPVWYTEPFQSEIDTAIVEQSEIALLVGSSRLAKSTVNEFLLLSQK